MRQYNQPASLHTEASPAAPQSWPTTVFRQFRMDSADPSTVSRPSLDPPLHLAAALVRLGGDAEPEKARLLLADLAQFFLEDSSELLRNLVAALAAGESREAERMAHSLKGLSATFDGHPTHRAAYAVERLAAAGDIAGAVAAMPELATEVERLCRALKAVATGPKTN